MIDIVNNNAKKRCFELEIEGPVEGLRLHLLNDLNPCQPGGRSMAAVRNNEALGRFELDVEGATAFANYRVTPRAVVITHTETPRALRGRGIASELIKGALDLIRADGHKVIARCDFVVDYLRKHPDNADLTA